MTAQGETELPDDPFPDPDDAYESQLAFNRAVADEVHKMRVREEARRRVERDHAGHQERPPVVALDQFLSVPDEDASYLIEDVWPTGGRINFNAQYKAGKTTVVSNAIRGLVDLEPFLGQYSVAHPVLVVLIDNELDKRMLRRWLRAQGIRNTSAVRLVSLRGRTGTFDILDPECRAAWASALRGADVVILDCLRPVLDALGLDENREAGRFLVAFDALLEEAGASEAMIVHHMGHNGERARGDSRLLDWPDATWKLVRERPDDEASARYFSAFGRDVDVPETLLSYDERTRRVIAEGGSRKDAQVEAAIPALLELLVEHKALSGRQVENRMSGSKFSRAQIRAALLRMHQQGLTVTYTGPKNATMHSPKPPQRASAP